MLSRHNQLRFILIIQYLSRYLVVTNPVMKDDDLLVSGLRHNDVGHYELQSYCLVIKNMASLGFRIHISENAKFVRFFIPVSSRRSGSWCRCFSPSGALTLETTFASGCTTTPITSGPSTGPVQRATPPASSRLACCLLAIYSALN